MPVDGLVALCGCVDRPYCSAECMWKDWPRHKIADYSRCPLVRSIDGPPPAISYGPNTIPAQKPLLEVTFPMTEPNMFVFMRLALQQIKSEHHAREYTSATDGTFKQFIVDQYGVDMCIQLRYYTLAKLSFFVETRTDMRVNAIELCNLSWCRAPLPALECHYRPAGVDCNSIVAALLDYATREHNTILCVANTIVHVFDELSFSSLGFVRGKMHDANQYWVYVPRDHNVN